MSSLNEAYDGLGIGFDNRQKCCGSQFYNMNAHISVGRKSVNITAIKAILERNQALKSMGSVPNMPVWTELGLTREEYLYVLKKYRKETESKIN